MIEEVELLKLHRDAVEKIINEKILLIFDYLKKIQNIDEIILKLRASKKRYDTHYNKIQNIDENILKLRASQKRYDTYYNNKIAKLERDKTEIVLNCHKEEVILKKALKRQEWLNRKINELIAQQAKILKICE